ncbi:NUDIX hydrolase [Sphaerisporangium fuscum]|uniref:NUDIX hydrolase n=1 Tax=Sphaerisporangium fuscum TaxID=2835868 RepID=UPI001BDC300A|nr:NUDIX hydrolase [Sphaerisporangium fuscum]
MASQLLGSTAKRCDNRSVGVLITDPAGRLLMFDRNTFPPGVAGAAGHIDGHGDEFDAARAEVSEELGLTVTSLSPVCSGWRDNRCRRLPGAEGIGHYWHIYRAEVTGTLTPSARETRNVRWLTPADLQTLTARTAAYARGQITNAQFAEAPGVEPVWVAWLVAAGVVNATRGDLDNIDRAAARGHGMDRKDSPVTSVRNHYGPAEITADGKVIAGGKQVSFTGVNADGSFPGEHGEEDQ